MSRRSSNHDENYKSDRKMRKKEKQLEAQICHFYTSNNLHVLLTDAMSQASAGEEEIPSLFMADYFLKAANTTIEDHYRKKIPRDQDSILQQRRELEAVTAEFAVLKKRRDELSDLLAARAVQASGEDESVGTPGQGKDMSAFKKPDDES